MNAVSVISSDLGTSGGLVLGLGLLRARANARAIRVTKGY